MPVLATRCPAKINLSLHVLARRADGMHALESLVAFAGHGDLLTLEPGPELSLAVEGPEAATLAGEADNLVLRAARALAGRVEGLATGAFRLTKRLPIASGIGGGSAPPPTPHPLSTPPARPAPTSPSASRRAPG
jgi:4-diphosphocytidyl-2-C-methyl-D-erythritol kinase